MSTSILPPHCRGFLWAPGCGAKRFGRPDGGDVRSVKGHVSLFRHRLGRRESHLGTSRRTLAGGAISGPVLRVPGVAGAESERPRLPAPDAQGSERARAGPPARIDSRSSHAVAVAVPPSAWRDGAERVAAPPRGTQRSCAGTA